MPEPEIVEVENVWITMSDGCRIAARIWLPASAEQTPVPAILEYIPYRTRDSCASATSRSIQQVIALSRC